MENKIVIKEIEKKDFKKAIKFAIKGMHFKEYTDSNFVLNLYGKYFWYMELLRSSEVIAAYNEDKFVGVLLAEMKGEKKVYKSFWKSLYVKFIDWLQKIFASGGVGPYDKANKDMLNEYKGKNELDGEICFLAADPDSKVRGIGSKLLEEFEKREKGKKVFLYTDTNCTYQFYEHRGFVRVGEKDIELDMKTKNVPLKCLMYYKEIK